MKNQVFFNTIRVTLKRYEIATEAKIVWFFNKYMTKNAIKKAEASHLILDWSKVVMSS